MLTECAVCEHEDLRRDRRQERFLRLEAPHVVLRCACCGLGMLDPVPGAADQGRRYAEAAFYAPAHQQECQPALRQCYGAILDNVEALVGPGRLLDIGCGIGEFLNVAQSRGWSTCGTEINPKLAAVARSLGSDVVECDMPTSAVFPQRIDAVTMLHVLEHTADPLAMLRGAYSVLRPGGVLVVQVPNALDWWLRLPLVRGHASRDIARRGLGWHHLTFFPPGALRFAVAKAGFRLERVSTYAPSNRRRLGASRYPGLGLMKPLFMTLADLFSRGPVVEVYATKE